MTHASIERLSSNLDTLFSSPDDVRACTGHAPQSCHHPCAHVFARPPNALISGGREAVDFGENSRFRVSVTSRADRFHSHPRGDVSTVNLFFCSELVALL